MAVQYPIAWHTVDKCSVDVEEAEKGVADYQCPDPDCGKPLIFKSNYNGTKFFTHKSTATCTGETWLHSTAIIIIQENNLVRIKGNEVNYTNVRTKDVINNRIPDAIIDTDSYPNLLVEVVVKSDLSKQKLVDLHAYNILRIYLEDLKTDIKNLNKEKLTHKVLYDTGRISLIPAGTYTPKPIHTSEKPKDYSWIGILLISAIAYLGVKRYKGHSNTDGRRTANRPKNYSKKKLYR